MVGRHHSRLAATHSGPPAVAGLRAQAFLLEQAGHAVPAAALAQVAHVHGELAVSERLRLYD